jgi:hypothetical protein
MMEGFTSLATISFKYGFCCTELEGTRIPQIDQLINMQLGPGVAEAV